VPLLAESYIRFMKIPHYLSNFALGVLFDAFRLVGTRIRKFIQDERLNFVIGLTKERFSHAEFYVNGRKDIRVAKSFAEMQILANHFCQAHHLKRVDSFLFLRMWTSRRLIRFTSDSVRVEIVTYWFF
jgi:hypothetical protein